MNILPLSNRSKPIATTTYSNNIECGPTSAQINLVNAFKLYTKTYALDQLIKQMERAFGIQNK